MTWRAVLAGILVALLESAAEVAPVGVEAQTGPANSSIRLGRTQPNGRTRVQTVDLDDYIAQVLAGEGQPAAADAAQEALAITARTFALANRNRHRSEGFDLCDTTHCQVVRPATPASRRAAAATSGRVLLHQGQPAFVFYSAWCGGHTESASQVWPGAIEYSAARSLEDEACDHEPEWRSEIRASDIERGLRSAGLAGSRLRGLRVLDRNDSERVSRIRVDGFTPNEISGHEFRMAVGRIAGFQSLKSAAFEVDRRGSVYRFTGRGYGHGVGLCVIGAGHRASRGAAAEEILRFYFPGLTVGRALAQTSTAASAPASSSRTTPVSTDVALTWPGADESERAALLILIRRSRDEVARATGATAPARLRVNVHASVDSFGRTTGQPWWASGFTDGTTIDLAPMALLRQRGQLDRTVRHEVAHAMLDAALAERRIWVREGAAGYFSAPPASRPKTQSRVTCPADGEFLRPLSAGAQRDALARAEACFARAVAGGKRWDEVR